MRTIAAWLLMAAAGWAQVRSGKVQEPPPPRPGKAEPVKKNSDKVEPSFRAGAEMAWDDNILELNNKQISQLEDGNRPEKFRIEEAGDFVYTVWGEVRLKGRLYQRPLQGGVKAGAHLYQENPIANYDEYETFLRLDLGRHEAGLEGRMEREVYLRELEIVVPGPNLWESAFYDEYEGSAYYQHRVLDALAVRGFAGWTRRDYDSPFGYRDREGPFAGLLGRLDLGKAASVFLKYEYSRQEAGASALEADTSYLQHELEGGGQVSFFSKQLQLSLKYRVGFREYTTSNDPAVDPSHVDREDLRQRLIFEVNAKIGKSWIVEFRYEYRNVISDRPYDDNATTSEPGDSTRNVVVLGLTFIL